MSCSPRSATASATAQGLDAATARALAAWRARSRYVPGFGHRFHPVDPRREPLLAMVAQAAAEGVVTGRYLRAALAVEAALEPGPDRPVPMNIDGATGVIYAELGFAPPLARGLFVLSRSHRHPRARAGRRASRAAVTRARCRRRSCPPTSGSRAVPARAADGGRPAVR